MALSKLQGKLNCLYFRVSLSCLFAPPAEYHPGQFCPRQWCLKQQPQDQNEFWVAGIFQNISNTLASIGTGLHVEIVQNSSNTVLWFNLDLWI